ESWPRALPTRRPFSMPRSTKGPRWSAGYSWRRLLLLSELLEILGSFFGRDSLFALDRLPNLFHHVRIGERRNVARVESVRDGCEDAPHDLSGPGFRHVRHDVHGFGPRDLSDHGLDRRRDLFLQLVARGEAGFQRDVDLRNTALDLIDDGHDRGLGGLVS